MRKFALRAASAALLLAASPPAAAASPSPSAQARVEEVLATIGTEDQAALERFVARTWSPKALAEYPVEDHASTLARIVMETHGLKLERMAGEGPGWIQARTRSTLTGVDYCLTLNREQGDGRDYLTDLSIKAIFPAGPELKPPTPEELSRRAEALIGAYDRIGQFGGVVLIAKDGKAFFRRAYGKASLAYDRPVTLDTRLSTASIAKSFTGVAIAQLVEAGKLSYDTRVGEVLPDYPNPTVREKVTVRMLLTHTSGLGDIFDHPKWPTLRTRIKDVKGYMALAAERPLLFQPGEKYDYSNVGYVMLGAIIEKVSGQDFYDYVRDHIFIPAGMTRSSYPLADAEAPDMAGQFTEFRDQGETGYVYKLGPPRNAILQGGLRGGPPGGAMVTGDDLMAFEAAFRSGKLVSPAMVRLMTTPAGPSVGGRRGAIASERPGLGLQLITTNGHVQEGHAGGDFGIISWAYHYPDTGYTVVALTNRDRPGRVLNALLTGLITRQTIKGATPPPQDCVPPEAKG